MSTSDQRRHHINNFDSEDFVANYWQQKPLIIRQGLVDFGNPISADELAGLACEEDIESRIVIEQDSHWSLQHGPFSEQSFQQLPKTHWTLLVQSVDHWLPEVAELRNYFNFIPTWRIDDVMISYAAKGGSVGPHYDNYDVFLVQCAGTRRWQVGPRYSSDSLLQANEQLKLLADFDCQQEWLLEPGDILYLPPQYGHLGRAEDDDCMTYSVGFRAPSHAELLAEFCDHNSATLSEEKRYTDASLSLQKNPGNINADSLANVQKILSSYINDPASLQQWFGRYMTSPKYQSERHTDLLDDDYLNDQFNNNTSISRDSACRFAYSSNGARSLLFVDGNDFPCSTSLAELITGHNQFSCQQLQPLLADAESFKLIKTLFEQDFLFFDDEDID
jgi:50S ribosomal protein L16 3-hydroxylase